MTQAPPNWGPLHDDSVLQAEPEAACQRS